MGAEGWGWGGGGTNNPQAIDGDFAVEFLDVLLPPTPCLGIGEVGEGGGARPHLIGQERTERRRSRDWKRGRRGVVKLSSHVF